MILARLKAWLAAAVAAVAAAFGFFWAGRKTGQAQQETKRVSRRVQVMEEARNVEDEIDGLSDAERRERVEPWMRED